MTPTPEEEMRPNAIALALLAMLALSFTGLVTHAEEKEEKKESKVQSTCPVSGGELDKANFVDYKGYRIYFCCNACPEEFKKAPEKHLKALLDEKVELEKAPDKPQELCIVSGKKVDKSIFADHNGYRVYFDSKESLEKFKKDADAWLVKLWLTGVTPLATPKETKPQLICPVMKLEHNKAMFVDYRGWRVYFCCRPCVGAFKSDPEKWLKIVLDTGVTPEKAPDKPQKECPISKKPVDKEIYTDHWGYRIYFDSTESRDKFLADPDKLIVPWLLTGVTPELAPKK